MYKCLLGSNSGYGNCLILNQTTVISKFLLSKLDMYNLSDPWIKKTPIRQKAESDPVCYIKRYVM